MGEGNCLKMYMGDVDLIFLYRHLVGRVSTRGVTESITLTITARQGSVSENPTVQHVRKMNDFALVTDHRCQGVEEKTRYAGLISDQNLVRTSLWRIH